MFPTIFHGGTEIVLFLRDSEIFTKKSVMTLFFFACVKGIIDCFVLIFTCLLEKLLLKEQHL